MNVIEKNQDIQKMNKTELLNKCKEMGITKYSSKNKEQLIELIKATNESTASTNESTASTNESTATTNESTATTNESTASTNESTATTNESTASTNESTASTNESTASTNESTASTNEKMKFIDLFCGIGSFHYSFKKLNWECVMSCDIDRAVKETYKENYGITPLGDITKIEPNNIPTYDIICAGFPCQPFSQCGQHKGFEDKRGTLFFHIMKFVEHHKPKIIILENVQGLLNHDEGKTFERIKCDIKAANYSITFKVLKCSDYGLPQMRKRLIIVGVRNDIPLVKHIEKILVLDEYKKEKTLSELLGKKFEKTTAYTIRCGGRNSPINDKHNWDGYIVDGKEYRLTKDDCLKIQGFGPEYKLCGNSNEQWKQLGNTIPTIFTEIIGMNIKKYLSC
jgi:DNA (cytosine-5)-methyltransferase 1